MRIHKLSTRAVLEVVLILLPPVVGLVFGGIFGMGFGFAGSIFNFKITKGNYSFREKVIRMLIYGAAPLAVYALLIGLLFAWLLTGSDF